MTEFLELMLNYLENDGILIGITFSVGTLALLSVHIVIHAYETISLRKDYMSGYRWAILFLYVTVALSLVPVLHYLLMRYTGIESEQLRNLATVAGRYAPFAFAIGLTLSRITIWLANRKTNKLEREKKDVRK